MTAPPPDPATLCGFGPRDDRIGEIYLDEAAIHRRVQELGTQITRDYQGQTLLLISILKGAIFFMADLARAIDLPLEMDFLAISSYMREHSETGTKAIRFLKDLDKPVKEENVLVVEDMQFYLLSPMYFLR